MKEGNFVHSFEREREGNYEHPLTERNEKKKKNRNFSQSLFKII